MPDVTVRWNTPNAPLKFENNLRSAPKWMPKVFRKSSRKIGRLGVDVMRDVTDINRYTGKLGRSISAEYSAGDTVITVSPKATRGRYDAGTLMEFGTRPIPRAPWAPIKAWANFRGAPMPGAWLKIRQRGVSPHPFLTRTLNAFMGDVDQILYAMLDDAIDYVFAGFGAQ